MLKNQEQYAVAVVGATGAVGREMLTILEERKFPISALHLFASEKSAGTSVEYGGRTVKVRQLDPRGFSGVDIALFSAGEDVSREFSPLAREAGAVVIDNSAAWRMDPEIPLIVPEVNRDVLQGHQGLIANPNCSTVQLVVALKPLHDAVYIKRVVVSTYQSVSGTGKEAVDELVDQVRALLNFQKFSSTVYPHQIAFNCLPQIGSFDQGGACTEEIKLAQETRKIMADDSILVTATTVRVPVFQAHCESVNIETERELSANEARAILSTAPGVIVYDDPQRSIYPLPVDVTGRDAVYVGRIREDTTVPHGLNLWIVSDNLRKGAALNAIQIAECLIRDSRAA